MKKILELTLILCALSVTATFTAFSHPHPGGTPAGFDGVKQIRSSNGGHFHQAYKNKPNTEDNPNKTNELEKVIGTYSDPLDGDGTVDPEGDGTVDPEGDGTVPEGSVTVDPEGDGTVPEGSVTVDPEGDGTVPEGDGTVDPEGDGTVTPDDDGEGDGGSLLFVNVIPQPLPTQSEKITEKAKIKRTKYVPKPKEIFCGEDKKWPKQDRISIVSVTEEKNPKRLIVTFKNDSNSYVNFKDPFMRIAIVDTNNAIKTLSEINRGNTSGRPWLLKESDDNPESETVGIITLSWHIRKKNIDTNWGNKLKPVDNVNKDGARFAMSLSYYNNKKGEDYSDWKKYKIVIMYNCISHEHFKKRKIGDIVRQDEIVASYTEIEKAPNAPSIPFIRKKSIVWAELKK